MLEEEAISSKRRDQAGPGWDGAAQESNLPSRGLHDRTGFEDRSVNRMVGAEMGRMEALRGSVRVISEFPIAGARLLGRRG